MHSFNDTAAVEMSNDVALRFKAHEALDIAKKAIKECYVNTNDSDDEDSYRYCLESLSEAISNLPNLPKAKENSEERRRQKEDEDF